jgi:hypothetical protein
MNVTRTSKRTWEILMAVELNCWTEQTLNSICVSGWRNECTPIACTTPILSANWGARVHVRGRLRKATANVSARCQRSRCVDPSTGEAARFPFSGRSPVMSKRCCWLHCACLCSSSPYIYLVLVPAACWKYRWNHIYVTMSCTTILVNRLG